MPVGYRFPGTGLLGGASIPCPLSSCQARSSCGATSGDGIQDEGGVFMPFCPPADVLDMRYNGLLASMAMARGPMIVTH
jgi:hypothetical protein